MQELSALFADALPDYVTDQQRAAILHQGAPLLIIAGPGSGKTGVYIALDSELALRRVRQITPMKFSIGRPGWGRVGKVLDLRMVSMRVCGEL